MKDRKMHAGLPEAADGQDLAWKLQKIR